MKRTRLPLRLRSLIGAPSLALAIAALIAAPTADAAFPGRPGPIVYAYFQSGPTWSVPGIFAHGPRRTQKPWQLAPVRSSSTIAVSPDGGQIAFSTFDGENPFNGVSSIASHIFVMNADGSAVRQLTDGRFFDAHPSFSPDGRRIVFQRAVEMNPAFDIYSVAVDGTGLLQLTGDPAGEFEPTFTPNGRRIVFVSDRDSDGTHNRSAIYSMRPDGGGVRALVDTFGNDSAPDVSPDGKRIVFSGASGRAGGIFVAGANGRDPRPLFRRENDFTDCYCLSDPVWSPDGMHVAALRSTGDSGFRYTTLLVMRADGRGGAKTFATGSLDEVVGSRVGPPAWGPRG